MKIKLQNGKQASDDAILTFEAKLGCRLSDSVRKFLRSSDGAKPEPNIFRISHDSDGGVTAFIPVDQIAKERTRIGDFPGKAYPVAWAECGNYVCVDEGRSGMVFFWDHEIREGKIDLAVDFDAFPDLLEPFDIRTVPVEARAGEEDLDRSQFYEDAQEIGSELGQWTFVAVVATTAGECAAFLGGLWSGLAIADGTKIYVGYGPPSADNMATSNAFRVFDTDTWKQIGPAQASIPLWSATMSVDGWFIYALAPKQHP